MSKKDNREKYAFSTSSKPEGKPQTGPRQVILLLGGTGEKVGREILADEELMADDHLRVGFIDSDEGAIGDLDRAQAYSLGGVPAQELVDELEESPSSFPGAELLGDPTELWQNLGPSDDINSGSPYGERKWGLVALWYHTLRYFLQLMTFLMGLIRDLNKYEDELNEDAAGNGRQRVSRKIRIICSLIFSCCGGTGSAIALYVVDLLNYFLRILWGIYRVEFEAHILLPGVFLSKAEDPQSLLAKAKATFMELVARYGQRFAPVQFAQLLLSRSRKPFTKMYIYDILNTEAAMATSRHQLAQVIKLVWQTISSGPIAARYRGLLERVRSEYPRVFSAAGIFVIEFPVEWMIKLLAHRLAAEIVEHHFLYTWPPDEARATAGQLLADFLNRHPEIRTLPAFLLDEQKRPRRVNVRRFKSLPRKLIPQAVETYMLQTLAAWQSGLEQQAQAEALKQGQVIARELEIIVNRRGGLDLAGYFLQALDAHLERLKGQVSREIERSRERSVRQQAPSGKLGWLTLRQDYLKRYERAMSGQVDQQTLIARLAFVNQLRTLIEGYRKMLVGWRGSLAELYERLLAAKARLVDEQQAQRSLVVESVVKDEDIDRFYNEGQADALEMITQGLHMTWLADEGKFILEYLTADQPNSNDRVSILSPEGMAWHVEYCQQAWYGLRELSIEQILRDRGEDPLAVAAELEQKALPWVAVKEVKQIPAEQKLLLLGTETGETGFWRGYATKLGIINFVATGDKTRIVFLYTAHALDVFNLRQAAAWDHAYEQGIQEGKPLHVVPELDPLVKQNRQEPQPVDETAEQAGAGEPGETDPVPVIEEQAV